MKNGLDFFCPGFKGTKEEGLRAIVDKQLSPSVLGRSVFCEDKLKDNVTNGCRQYVVFAAGYDTFSLRNRDKSLIVFELDYPQIIEDKMERINKAGLISSAISVPCNLADKTWKNKLLAHGYDKDKKASGAGEQMKALYSYKEIDMISDKYGFIIEQAEICIFY